MEIVVVVGRAAEVKEWMTGGVMEYTGLPNSFQSSMVGRLVAVIIISSSLL